VVLGLALAAAAVLAGMVLARGRTPAVVLVIAAGLIFGPIFPTIIAILLGHFAESLHGRAVGLFFAIGGVGWSAIPMVIGAYARRAGVRRGLTVAVGTALGLSAVALILTLR
jgi:fucose permease